MIRVRENKTASRTRATAFLLAMVCAFVLLSLPNRLHAQQSEHVGIPLDWSTRRILFTNGGTPEVRAKAAQDIRSWINWNQRSSYLFYRGPSHRPSRPKRHPRIDWAM